MCSSDRYSVEQVLNGLREFWPEYDDPAFAATFESSTPIPNWPGPSDWLNDFDLGELAALLEDFFGFNTEDKNWENYFAMQSPPTMGDLARFIAERAPIANVTPVRLFGEPCATAGAFRLLQSTLSRFARRSQRLAPSSKISTHLKGADLRRFWAFLRFITNSKLPRLESRISKRVLSVVRSSTAVGLAGLILVGSTDYPILEPMRPVIWPTVAGIVLLFCFISFADYRTNPLPEGISTFGDLARKIALFHPDFSRVERTC